MILKSSRGGELYVEDFRVRVFEKLRLLPVRERLKVLRREGWNTFRIPLDDVFLDFLTDSGVSAASTRQLSDLMGIGLEDSYAGNRAFYRLRETMEELFPHKHLILTHQGRAAENIVFKVLTEDGRKPYVLTNVHFTTTRAIVEAVYGGRVLEFPHPEAFNVESEYPFKANMDVASLENAVRELGPERIAAVRMEFCGNLLGGQPFSMDNFEEVREVCDRYGIPLVSDVSMLDWQVALMRLRDPKCGGMHAREVAWRLLEMTDVAYASARKGFYVRGGFITTGNSELYEKMRVWQPVFEGHSTYGGMSLKEVAMLIDGVRMALDDNLPLYEIKQVEYLVRELDRLGVPVVKPPGGLGLHVDARRFLPHVPLTPPSPGSGGYPAGALSAAVYLVSGVRTMERGQVSMDRDPETRQEVPVKLDLVRFGVPRKTYLRGHLEYIVDRVSWLYEHRDVVKGLVWTYEPPVMRFFEGTFTDEEGWSEELARVYERELGDF
ncbi:tryptophanase [Infirmifilum sp. NZ]|uniref:tryptophanase n=1 Tax=Infirmifilum sp. NZ TaxID=2926850 RepID=UPI0027A7539C|nr:tryptophanase [Infirmifilum sp. NZ]UNQ73570.1 tryptophanase [Infirmifilum sp. NZ]